MKSILDPTFRYVPSVETDLRKTFARVRRELRGGSPKTSEPPVTNAIRPGKESEFAGVRALENVTPWRESSAKAEFGWAAT